MTSETLRDHFAAAALTGLLAQGDDGSFSEESYARGAYRWADAMLCERERTNRDAAPAARASVDSVAPQPTTDGRERTDKSPARTVDGTGDKHARFCSAVMNWLSEATSAYSPACSSDGGRKIMADACSRCWDAFDRIAYPTTTHSASACDGVDVLSTPDSGGRINRAAHGGQPPARSGESERRDVPQPDNGRAAGGPAHNTQEPVAWGVAGSKGLLYATSVSRMDAVDMQSEHECVTEVIPLYRHPPVTEPLPKTKRAEVSAAPAAWYVQERADLKMWLAECLRQASTATEGCNEELAERWQGRAKRAAAMIERLGGGK